MNKPLTQSSRQLGISNAMRCGLIPLPVVRTLAAFQSSVFERNLQNFVNGRSQITNWKPIHRTIVRYHPTQQPMFEASQSITSVRHLRAETEGESSPYWRDPIRVG